MDKSVIINKNKAIYIENDELLSYLNKLIEQSPKNKQLFENYKKRQFFWEDSMIIDYFVKVLGATIIHDKTVYFQNELKSNIIDKIEYVKIGYKLNKMPKMIYRNGRFINYVSPIQKEIEKEGFTHSISEENNLSYWYPKTAKVGFKTPKTIIMNFSDEEIKMIKTGKWNDLNEEEIIKRIYSISNSGKLIDLDEEMFVRLGNSSNKFNFDSCHINNVKELYKKLMIMFDDMYFKLEWQENIELVLREYIKTKYNRNQIYNGMPLNTEFRVFYDFDKKEVLGIFNYWEKDTMLDNLKNNDDVIAFANSVEELEQDFIKLSPVLKKEAESKLSKANLKGKWSVDFLYDGEEFVLIDMAHAESSYYYDKVLTNKTMKPNKR